MTKKKTLALSFSLVLIILGGVLFIGAVSGWFSEKTRLSEEYYCGEECKLEFMPLAVEELEELRAEKKSFIVFVDQDGCNTADRLEGFMLDYMDREKVSAYKMMFSDLRETEVYKTVRFYPSVIVFKEGRILRALRADADEDSNAYNYEEAFNEWIYRIVE